MTFVSVGLVNTKRVIRLRPEAVAYHEPDFEGNAVVHLLTGEVLTLLHTPKELERLFEPARPKAAK